MTTTAAPHTPESRASGQETPASPTRIIDLTEAASSASLPEKLTVQRPVLSVAEAAELLGVSEWLVLRQISRGELPHKRCGRRIVLSRERLLAWLNDG